MFVDIEFFSDEPLDNVVSSLKFKYDKVIFFGYSDEAMDDIAKDTVRHFLMLPHIGVSKVKFVDLPDKSYAQIERAIEKRIEKETNAGNECFIDLTGGDELALAPAGMLSTKYQIPMSIIDIEENNVQLLAFTEKYDKLPRRDIHLKLEEFFHLHRAVIDWTQHKDENKGFYTPEFVDTINRLQNYTRRMGAEWNRLSSAMAYLSSDQEINICQPRCEIERAARVSNYALHKIIKNIERLYHNKFLTDYTYDGGYLRFSFPSAMSQDILCSAGAILEHYTYCKVLSNKGADDCGIGYHLDWEGDGNPGYTQPDSDDVINEIDVVYIKNNIPTFISCKNLNVSGNQPLYELETVADRFGGSYAHKVLFASGGASKSVMNRAKEMGIRIIRDIY